MHDFTPWHLKVLPTHIRWGFQAFRHAQGPLVRAAVGVPPIPDFYDINHFAASADRMAWTWVDLRSFIVPIFFVRAGNIGASPGPGGIRRRTRVIGGGAQPVILEPGSGFPETLPGSIEASPQVGGGIRREPPAFWLPGDTPDA